MHRILVLGCPGSGKSTFARALAAKTGLPLHYLDRIYWNADRTTVGKACFLQRLDAVLAQEEWILDGNYASTLERRLQRCDTVFFLDVPAEVCQNGVRERLGKPRPDMPWVETEEDVELTALIRNFAQDTRPAMLEQLRACSCCFDRSI